MVPWEQSRPTPDQPPQILTDLPRSTELGASPQPGEPDSLLLAFEDITRRKAEEQRLAETETALREANRRKDEFLAMLSHELRNPLAPIRTSLFVLANSDNTSKAAVRAREIAERQVARAGLRDGVDFRGERFEVRVGDGFAVDPDPLMEPDQVRRGVEPGAEPGMPQDRGEHRAYGAFAVRARDMDARKRGVRVAHALEHGPDRGQVELHDVGAAAVEGCQHVECSR